MREEMRALEAWIVERVPSETVRTLLESSLFYYCCGKDPTPIAAFGERIPLYVYADSFRALRGSPSEVTAVLERRLQGGRMKKKEETPLPFPSSRGTEGAAALSRWETETGEAFLLLFVRADACFAFARIYGELLPRCFCNYRYEMSNRGSLELAERRAEFILGHCFDEAYLPVADLPYLGDYGRGTRVTLHQRRRNSLDGD